MNPQEEFALWYRTVIGITLEEARRQGVSDLKMLRAAYMAGWFAGHLAGNNRTLKEKKPDEF